MRHIPYLHVEENRKDIPIMHPDLALWLTLISSNYPCLEHIFMVRTIEVLLYKTIRGLSIKYKQIKYWPFLIQVACPGMNLMNWNTPINKNARLKLSKIFRCVDLDQPIGLYFRLSIFFDKNVRPSSLLHTIWYSCQTKTCYKHKTEDRCFKYSLQVQ